MKFDEKEYRGLLLDVEIKIGYYRRRTGMTQEELADEIGLTLSCVSQLESPSIPYAPSIKTLYKLAKAFGVEITDLIIRRFITSVITCLLLNHHF